MRRGAVLGIVAVVALAGCTGSTEPATDVRYDDARLNARGTADNGPAYSYFELWPTARPEVKLTTFRRSWPAGASGPISEQLAGYAPLYAGTAYSFRVCGGDEGATATCAQTRTFTTPQAPHDAVRGAWRESDIESPHTNRGAVRVAAGPAGVTGTLSYASRRGLVYDYAGRVTCLQVTGTRAVVGTVGDYTTNGSAPDPNRNPPVGNAIVTIVDGGPGTRDQVGVRFTPGTSAPPNCADAPAPGTVGTESVNVFDAP